MNEHFLHLLVKERLAEARAFAAKRRLARSLRRPRLPIRVRLGLILLRVGRWLLREGREGGREPIRPA
ncbi:MAG: hypothetical protein L0214_00070 [candidate division NC10 bacterium]|nr:hypothetical protein [candidate division NC10 bacterium]